MLEEKNTVIDLKYIWYIGCSAGIEKQGATDEFRKNDLLPDYGFHANV
jgi:hypothetical protein